jgi:hypothetical protein
MTKMGKRRQTFIGKKRDAAATAAIAAVWPASRYEFLAAEAHCPITTSPRNDVDIDEIDHDSII